MISLLSTQYLTTLLSIFNSIFEERAFPESWLHSIFGFRKKKSCHDNLGILLSDIYNGFALNKPTACLFLDVVGVFNKKLLEIFELDLPSKLCQFVYNLIHLRKLQFVINGEFSDTLFSSRGILNNKCDILQFADIVLYFRSPNIVQSLKSVEQSANKLASYLESKELSISPSKSALVVFSRRRKSSLSHSLNLQNSVIISSTSHRFLGIILDSKHNSHIDLLSKKYSKLFNILKSLRRIWWRANPNLLLSIYKSLIRGSMEYSFPYIRINNCTQLEKLEKIQRQALRLCLSLRQSTLTNVTLAESGIGSLIPLQIQIRLPGIQIYHQNNFMLHNAFLKFKPYKSKIASFDLLPIYMHDLNIFPTTVDLHLTLPDIVNDIKKASVPQIIFMATYYQLIHGSQCFYTDASKTDSSDYIDGCASVFTGETLALLKCFDFILLKQFSNSTIFTDSRSLVESLFLAKPPKDQNHLILDIKRKLKIANLSNLTISIIWIPTDLLAKRAILTGKSLSEPVPHSDFFSLALTIYHHHLKSSGKSHGKKKYFSLPLLFFSPLPVSIAATSLLLPPVSAVILFKTSITSSGPAPIFGSIDLTYFSSLEKKTKKPLPPDIFKILSNPSPAIISCLASFFKRNNLNI
ncbi:hypothetical protein ACFW04_000220 [Cataglyphis niger]